MNENVKCYEPTPSENSLLLVMGNIEFYTESVTKICKEAGVSRNVYYKAMNKPGFVVKRKEIMDKVFNSLMPDVKAAAVKYALNNAKNHQDRKLILEMGGEYTPKKEIENTNKNIEIKLVD